MIQRQEMPRVELSRKLPANIFPKIGRILFAGVSKDDFEF